MFKNLRKEYRDDIANQLSFNILVNDGELFSEEDIAPLPPVLQAYLRRSFFIGKCKMSRLMMEYRDVAFAQGRKGPKMRIDYSQCNFIARPARLALIESRLFGIPFDGYDYWSEGVGGMKGVIGNVLTLFDQRGPEMDKACLVTFLAECLFAPSSLLQNYISFEQSGEYEVRATIEYMGQSAQGVFHFNDNYELTTFTTTDRAATDKDGHMEYIPWSAICGDYLMSSDGIKLPTTFKAVWHYPDEDFVYFNGRIDSVSYGY